MANLMRTHYQTIIIRLSDGRTVQSTVPAFCDETDTDLRVVGPVTITTPMPLPDGAYWPEDVLAVAVKVTNGPEDSESV